MLKGDKREKRYQKRYQKRDLSNVDLPGYLFYAYLEEYHRQEFSRTYLIRQKYLDLWTVYKDL
jgi:hypothetical protein